MLKKSVQSKKDVWWWRWDLNLDLFGPKAYALSMMLLPLTDGSKEI